MKKIFLLSVASLSLLLTACQTEVDVHEDVEHINNKIQTFEQKLDTELQSFATILDVKNIGKETLYVLDENRLPLLTIDKNSTDTDVLHYESLYREFVIPAQNYLDKNSKFKLSYSIAYNEKEKKVSKQRTLYNLRYFNEGEINQEEEGFKLFFKETDLSLLGAEFYRSNSNFSYPTSTYTNEKIHKYYYYFYKTDTKKNK